LGHGLDEAFDAPFGRVVEAEARIGHLAALRGDLHDAPAALLAQMRQDRPNELDGAGQIGGNLVVDLRVAQFLGGTAQAIARIADHDVDPAHAPECFSDRRPDTIGVHHVELRHDKGVAVLVFKICEGAVPPYRRDNPVAAGQQPLGHDPAETGRCAGDEPRFSHDILH
jgi:hypothetical protein